MNNRFLFSSPLRYPGGKASLSSFLIEVIYFNNLQGGVYVEPFAGGAGAGMRLLSDGHVDQIVVNDKDKMIYQCWKSIMTETDEFVEKILTIPLTIDSWYEQRAIYQSPAGKSKIEIGFATFFLNRCNRSGIIKGGGPIGGVAQKGAWKLDARFNRLALSERVREIASYGDRIEVSNKDAKALIQLIDTRARSELIFAYIDPPYYVKGRELYLSHFADGDHSDLADALHSCGRLAWVMTYDAAPRIRDLYSNLTIHDFSLRYSAHHSSQEGGELLICPQRVKVSAEARRLLQSLGRKRAGVDE